MFELDLWEKVVGTALPAFIFGHGFLAISWLDKKRGSAWRVLSYSGYSAMGLCLFVGILLGVWT